MMYGRTDGQVKERQADQWYQGGKFGGSRVVASWDINEVVEHDGSNDGS